MIIFVKKYGPYRSGTIGSFSEEIEKRMIGLGVASRITKPATVVVPQCRSIVTKGGENADKPATTRSGV